jgi:hypothetical protein
MPTVYVATECMKCGSNITIKITDYSESSAYCYPCASAKFNSIERIQQAQHRLEEEQC